jgi:hypothetical protein
MLTYTQITSKTLYPEILQVYKSNQDYFDLSETSSINFAQIDKDVHAKPDIVASEDKKYFLIKDKQNKPIAILDYLLNYPDKNTVFLGFLLVDKTCQSQGIGRAILKEQKEH